MIPRTTTRRLLRELSSPRASPRLRPAATIRPFTTTPRSLLSPQRPPSNLPPSPLQLQQQQQQQQTASAALQNLSHLTPAQITTLLSAAPPAGGAPPGSAAGAGPEQPSRRSVLLRRRFLWAALFFAVGYKLTSDQIHSIRFFLPLIYPPVEGIPPEEFPAVRAQALATVGSDVPAIEAMLSYVDVSSGQPRLRPTNWDAWEPYEGFSPERRARHLCAGTLNNPNAMGVVHHVFRHRLTGELVVAVVFGQGTSGWPGVVHGGMLSTVMDEAMGRLAALSFPANTAVTAKLRLDFQEPVAPGVPYLVRVHKMVPELQRDRSTGEDKTDRKLWVFGRMEGPDGEVALEASGLFVVPKGIEVEPLGHRF